MSDDVDTAQENNRLITLMMQVATMDGKLDIMIGNLADRVKNLEDKNKGSGGTIVSVIALLISGLMVLITLGGKITWS